jgi:hypothetical protein
MTAWPRSVAAAAVALELALVVGLTSACRRAPIDEAPRPALAGGAAGAAPRSSATAPPRATAEPKPGTGAEVPGDESLVGEAPESDPRSETVTIRLYAEPARKARVFWGRKDLGTAPLEVTRPRNSGPLDLVVVAPGALTLHTRAFTDRDDRLSLRLYAEGDAPTLLGYHLPDSVPQDKQGDKQGDKQDKAPPRADAARRKSPSGAP